MGYHVAPTRDELPPIDQVAVGCFALVGGTEWYKNGALSRGWIPLDHTPQPYVDDDDIDWEDDDDEEDIAWEEV